MVRRRRKPPLRERRDVGGREGRGRREKEEEGMKVRRRIRRRGRRKFRAILCGTRKDSKSHLETVKRTAAKLEKYLQELLCP